MKAKDLIERLARLPEGAEVSISDGEFCSSYVTELHLYVSDSGDCTIEPGDDSESVEARCESAGHPLTHVYGGSGPRTRVCECGERSGETICAQCGTPWATNDGHDQSCFMWQAMHSDPDDHSPLAQLDRLCLGESESP